ncbi:MAG TPA: ammonia-forming cytochrome c nitrite reductase subunit c552 [Thermoanaerobaculia bacterium]|nr:ammonia-forming cytochrome c nitrite reductase subunit c552 [Thermoanaerobaculia bacterium]
MLQRRKARVRGTLLILTLVVLACHRETPHAAMKKTTSDSQFESLPSHNAYAGSASCKECHEKNFERWSHDWHARAVAPANAKTVAGDFAHQHFRGESTEAWMSRNGDTFVMRTRNREGQPANYPVAWVIGGKRMQDAVTVLPDGRWQVLPVYFHITGGGAWVDYNEAKQGRVTPDHPFFWTNFRRTANKECLECHATGVDVRYDRAAHTWSTELTDAGVACEACHGPGARHAETKNKDDIVRPDHIDKELALSICARCHGPHDPLFPLLDTKDQFRPGERYDDRYQALVITDGAERSGEYFADGRPSSSTFETQALLQSRCYRIGGATCLSCHTAPHAEAHGVDELKAGPADGSCRKCHAAIAAQARAHTHHSAATCLDCHMPKVLTGVLDTFSDHSIDVPNVRNTISHGVPNACSVCHRDQSAGALATAVETWWPAARDRNARRVRLADAIDEKTAAASLPALAAVVRDAGEAPSLRGAAAVILGQRFGTAAGDVITPLLHDPNQVVRARFIEALGYANARQSADAIASLVDDSAIRVRQNAALVLASFDDARAPAALSKLATNPATTHLSRPHILRGIGAANRGEFDTAIHELEFALQDAPYATDALVLLADIYARRGDVPHARALLEEALRFDPGHRGARARLEAAAEGR